MWIQLLLPLITPKQSKKKEKKKKKQAINGSGGKVIGLQPEPMVTLSICVQRWTATFPQCVSICPTVWGCIYMSVFHYTLCVWIIVSSRVSTSVPIHAFFPWKFVYQLFCSGWWGYQMAACISLPSHQWAAPSSLSTKSKTQLPPCGFHNYTTHQDKERWGIPMSKEG